MRDFQDVLCYNLTLTGKEEKNAVSPVIPRLAAFTQKHKYVADRLFFHIAQRFFYLAKPHPLFLEIDAGCFAYRVRDRTSVIEQIEIALLPRAR
jgi:hypothetical protein